MAISDRMRNALERYETQYNLQNIDEYENNYNPPLSSSLSQTPVNTFASDIENQSLSQNIPQPSYIDSPSIDFDV